MMTLTRLNGTNIEAHEAFQYVEFLGINFGSTEIVNFNRWGTLSKSPIMLPIANQTFQTATVRFLIRGVPSQLELEKAITNLVMEFRGKANPRLDFNGAPRSAGAFSFVGQCTECEVNRIIKSQVAEVTLTIEGFKFVEEYIVYTRGSSDDLFTSVKIESPMIIEFVADSTAGMIATGDFVGEFTNLELDAEYVWDGFSHTLTKSGENSIGNITHLNFPFASIGGTVVSTTFNALRITVYRRLL